MKKILLILVAVGMTGCASYKTSSLNHLSSEMLINKPAATKGQVVVAAKAFDRRDCIRFLDRDVLRKGYQPVQLYIQNDSEKSYFFSLNKISLPCAPSYEVAERVHTSTLGRILGYGIPGLFFAWPLLIPAVVDGIKSSEANELLDQDFSVKTARDQVIFPHTSLNKIIFIPVGEYQSIFTVTIMDQKSNELKSFKVIAQG